MIWIYFIILFIVTHAIEYLFSKKVLNNGDPLIFSLLRAFFGFLFILTLVPFIDIRITFVEFFMIFGLSLIGAIGIYYRSDSIKRFQISYVSPMLSFVSPFVFILAVIFLGEKITLIRICAIALVTVSLFLLNMPEKDKSFKIFKSFIKNKKCIILIPIILFSVTNVVDRFLLLRIKPFVFMFYVTLFFIINYSFVIILKKKTEELKSTVSKSYKSYIVIGLLMFLTQIGQYFAKSLQEISVVTPLLLVAPIFVIIFSKKFFNDSNIMRKLISSVLLILGVFLLLL